jgi:hypothetical protein
MIDHVSFLASGCSRSRDFHLAALPSHYGAFVLDPDGHDVEAVCRAPE